MPGKTYDVEVRYFSSGNLGLPTRNINASLASLERGFEGLGSGVLKSVASTIDGIAATLMTAGAAAGAGLAAGLSVAAAVATKMNAELEETQISLAGIFMASGKASPFVSAMQLGDTVMQKMRKDAQALPGEFKDLVDIFQTISISGFRAGASVSELEKFSAKTMAIGSITRLQPQVVAREMAGLLEGRAGAHNILGMRLLGLSGDQAKEFNAKAPAERLRILTETLGKYDDAISAYQYSFKGLSTSLSDQIKIFAAAGGKPIFEAMKFQMIRATQWMQDNQRSITNFVSEVGEEIAKAFNSGIEIILKWWPAIKSFSTRAYNELVSMWEAIEPIVNRVGESIRKFLLDPAAISKIENVVKLALALRAGAGLGSLVGGISGMAGGAAAAPVGIGAALGAVPGGMGIFGAVDLLMDKNNPQHAAAVASLGVSSKNAGEGLDNLKRVSDVLSPLLHDVADWMGGNLLSGLMGLSSLFNVLSKAVADTIDPFSQFRKEVGEMVLHNREKFVKSKTLDESIEGDRVKNLTPPQTNVHIGNVNFNFAPSNEDPARIARRVESTLVDLARRAKSSRRGFNGAAYR